MQQLSKDLAKKMRRAGFTTDRLRLHQLLAQVYEEILNKRERLVEELLHSYLNSQTDEELRKTYANYVNSDPTFTDAGRAEVLNMSIEHIRYVYTHEYQYVNYICGSFAEALGCNLSQQNGQLSPSSDLDTSYINKKKDTYHFEGCDCGQAAEGHPVATTTAEGHYTLTDVSASLTSPARAYPAQSCKAAQDSVLAKQAACLPKQSVYKTGTLTEHGVHFVTAGRPGHQGTEYRISYSLFERQIFYEMNPIIGLVFIILKYIIKEKLSEHGLRSYHAKTLAFLLTFRYKDRELKESDLLDLVKEAFHILIDDNGLLQHALHKDAVVYLKGTDFTKAQLADILNNYITDAEFETLVREFMNQLQPLTNDQYYAQPFSYLCLYFAHLSKPMSRCEQIVSCLSVQDVCLILDKVNFYLDFLSRCNKNSAVWDCMVDLRNQLFGDCPPESSAFAVKLILTVITAEWVGDSDTSRDLLMTSLSSIQFKHMQVPSDTDLDIKTHIWNHLENSHSLWLFPVDKISFEVLPALFQDLQYKTDDNIVINLRAVLNVYRCQHLSHDQYSPEKWFTELQTEPFLDWQDVYAFAQTSTNLEHLYWSKSHLISLARHELDRKRNRRVRLRIRKLQLMTFGVFKYR